MNAIRAPPDHNRVIMFFPTRAEATRVDTGKEEFVAPIPCFAAGTGERHTSRESDRHEAKGLNPSNES